MQQKKKTWLSPTGISAMDRCPRCFWIRYNHRIFQPEGIVSRLASRFDVVVKEYFDKYRKEGRLPPLVEGQMEGMLQNPFIEAYFYHHTDGKYGYFGKLDECLVTEEGLHTPVDHKTSSSDPRKREGIFPAYQHQLDSYAWLLEANRKKTTGIAHLLYFYPDAGGTLHEGFPMVTLVKTLETDPERAEKKFLEAIEILEGPMPGPLPECPFCSWHDTMNGILDKRNSAESGKKEQGIAKDDNIGTEDMKKAWEKGRLF